MTNLRIGIDFDDVTIDFVGSLVRWHNKKFNHSHTKEHFKEFAWWPVWGITKEESVKRVNEFTDTMTPQNTEVMDGAIQSIEKIMKKHEVVFITGRPLKYKKKTEEWIEYNLSKKIEVIMAGDFHKGQAATKAEICKERKIPILLEDALETAVDCAKSGIKVVLFDQPWNQNAQHKNITRVKSWKEALKEIEIL